MTEKAILKRENKQPLDYTVTKRGLYKKKLAPKGHAWLVVTIKKGKQKYSMKNIIQLDVGKDLELMRAEQMVEDLTEHYGI